MVTGTKDYKALGAIRPHLGGGNVLSKKAEIKQPPSARPTGSYLLRTVPQNEGFHFFTQLGEYTGLTATNTVQFAEQLQEIPIRSVIFHFKRHDFQTWFRDIIGDEELAEKIDEITAWSSEENLREELFNKVQNRLLTLFLNGIQ